MAYLHRACPLCGTDNEKRPESRYSKGEWKIKECSKCSFVYLENPPPYAELEENFAWEKTFAKETDFRRRRTPLLYWISTKNKEFKGKYLKRNKLRDLLKALSVRGKVLEVGCAGGHILKSLGVNYFTPVSFREALSGTGFSIEKFSFSDRLPTSDNMWLVAARPAR